MSKHLFIFGAGASVGAGAPVMKDFLDKAYDLFLRKNCKAIESFKNVFENIGKLQLVHSKAQLDIVNLESIFNAFEMAKLIDRLGDLRGEKIDDLIKDLKIVIVETLERTIAFPVSQENGIISPGEYHLFGRSLSKLLKDGHQASFSFISFNYDVCLDFALERNGFQISYGLDEEDNQGIPVLKLHGSLNWFADKDGKVHNCKVADAFRNIGPIFDNRIRLDSVGLFRAIIQNRTLQPLDSIPTIIPPAWNKSNHHENIKNVWRRAAAELASAEHIHVIGFSMPPTDAYFSMLFALGSVSDKPIRSINIYNPDDSGVIKKRFSDLLGPGSLARFDYNEVDFKGALAKIDSLMRATA